MDDKYELMLLPTTEAIDHYWPAAKPYIDRCVEETMRDKLTSETIYNMVASGEAFMLVVARNDDEGMPDVLLVFIMSLVNYPKLPTMNIIAVGGSDIGFFVDKYWKTLQSWMYVNGVRNVEATVSDAFARTLSKYGFTKKANLVGTLISGYEDD